MRAKVAGEEGITATQVLTDAVAMAVMAPSSHNSQPWRFRIVGGTTLEIYADESRHLTVIDAERRQLIQSCGCAFYNARAAVRAMGRQDVVTSMFGEPGHPGLLATLRLGAAHAATHHDHALIRAIPLRRTNRRAFEPRPVPDDDVAQLAAAAQREGAWMECLDPVRKQHLCVLVDQADRQQFDDPEFRAELGKWLRPFGSRHKDGIPFVEKEYGSALPFTAVRALRSPTLGAEFGSTEQELVRGSPVVAVLGTSSDDAADWFACGQALQAVLLEATALGLSAAFLNQVLEIPALRGKVAELVEGTFPHMVLRLGHASEPVHRAAPRRELDEVLEVVP
jgi:nitroreductase